MTLPALDDLVAEVRRIAADDPEAGAFWSNNWVVNLAGEKVPHSIIGYALLGLGATTDEVPSGENIFWLYPRGDPRAVWLRRVQALQNVGVFWGRAVERADEGPVLEKGFIVHLGPLDCDGDPELTV